MKELQEETFETVGYADSLESMRAKIEERIHWRVVGIVPSTQFTYKNKECYDLITLRGVRNDMVIVNEDGKYALYYMSL